MKKRALAALSLEQRGEEPWKASFLCPGCGQETGRALACGPATDARKAREHAWAWLCALVEPQPVWCHGEAEAWREPPHVVREDGIWCKGCSEGKP